MSQGSPKTNARYQDQHDPLKFHGITVQNKTNTLTIDGVKNDIPPDDVTEVGKMTVSTTGRQRGKRPMTVTCKWASTVPTDYKTSGTITLPALNNAIQRAILTAFQGVTMGTYNGHDVIYMSHRSQKIR